MIKILFVTLVLISTSTCFSQVKFESGYFIRNNGEKTICLIKNVDWENNPKRFFYKLSSSAQQQTIDITSVKEFGIDKFSKYIKFSGDIDTSSAKLDLLSKNRNPEFKSDTFFLKVIVEGKATLYYYKSKKITRYFYKVDSSAIQQLVYKEYLIDDLNVRTNAFYKQQLTNTLVCDDKLKLQIDNSRYALRDLEKIFINYNQCTGSAAANFSKRASSLFNLVIRPGINIPNLFIEFLPGSIYYSKKFENKLAFRLGVEAEFILPFNKNKWSLLAEPVYQYYKVGENRSDPGTFVDYSSIELIFGLRHYFFLNDQSKLFINGSYLMDLPFNSKLGYGIGATLDISSARNIVFGAGYNYNDKYSIEIRSGTRRNLIKEYAYWKSEYKAISVIFGYTIF